MHGLFALILSFSFAATPVSRTVAEVGSYVITSREVTIAGVLDRWFLTKGAAQKKKKIDRADWIVESNDAFQKQLTQVMLEVLVLFEADSFSVVQISQEDIKKNSEQITADLADWAPWKKLNVSTAELENQISRNIRAKAFIKFKTESSGLQVTDEEAKSYHEKNRVRFGNLPYEQFKDSIKEYLTQRQLEDKLKDWFEALRRKHRVRFLNPPAKA